MKHSLSIIGLLFALVGMLAGTALAGPQSAFLEPTGFEGFEGIGSALVFEIPTSRREILKSWAVEVEGLLPDATYSLFNHGTMSSDCTGPILTFPNTDGNGDAATSMLTSADVEPVVDVCREIEGRPTPILTGTLRKGGKPRRH